MPFSRPSLPDLITQAQADFSAVPGVNPALRYALSGVLAKTAAALANGEYGYLDWMVANVLLPDSATGGYLDRWANIVGLQREAATTAAGFVMFTGQPTLDVPAGTQLQDSTGAVLATTQGTVTMGAGGSGTVNVLATGGAAANLPTAAPMTMLVAIAGIVAVATVVAPGLTGGADIESDAALRIRLLARLASPPQGGAANDYIAWAKLYPGVTRVFVYPLQTGPNTVTVIFTMDGRANIIPLAGDVAAVAAVIAPLRPVTAQVTVLAPVPVAINITIANLSLATGYALATVQANIAASLALLFVTTMPGGTLFYDQIVAAISNAAGVVSFDLSAPVIDTPIGFGDLAQLGTLLFP